MNALELGPVLGLLLLGAVHGINPGMGWLFAVALGLQERKGRAVWRALPPLAFGHACAIAVAAAAALLAGQFLPREALRWVVAASLLALGLHRLRGAHGHARLGGMRVGWRRLTAWSFLMASAHGAGLMVLPLLLGGASPAAAGGHAAHGHGVAAAGGGTEVLQAGLAGAPLAALSAALIHSAGYLLITALCALLVYRWLGLRLLRTAWINLDAIWAGALVLTAIVTVLV